MHAEMVSGRVVRGDWSRNREIARPFFGRDQDVVGSACYSLREQVQRPACATSQPITLPVHSGKGLSGAMNVSLSTQHRLSLRGRNRQVDGVSGRRRSPVIGGYPLQTNCSRSASIVERLVLNPAAGSCPRRTSAALGTGHSSAFVSVALAGLHAGTDPVSFLLARTGTPDPEATSAALNPSPRSGRHVSVPGPPKGLHLARPRHSKASSCASPFMLPVYPPARLPNLLL